MRLLLVRHASAVPRGTPGVPDDERPLTPRGERRFRRAAQGLASALARPDAVLTSPLSRAAATAALLAEAWGRLEPRPEPALVGGTLDELQAALRGFEADATVALVGHEPDLSEWLGALLGCPRGQGLAFRKGGAALVEVPGTLAEGGRLLAFLPPRLLRRLVADSAA